MKHWPLFTQIQYLVHWIPRHSVVNAVTVQFPAETRQHSIHQSIQTGCGSHPTSIKWVERKFSPGGKSTRLEAHHSAPHSVTFVRDNGEWGMTSLIHISTPQLLYPLIPGGWVGPRVVIFLNESRKTSASAKNRNPHFPVIQHVAKPLWQSYLSCLLHWWHYLI
jgi:hypothetical protein